MPHTPFECGRLHVKEKDRECSEHEIKVDLFFLPG